MSKAAALASKEVTNIGAKPILQSQQLRCPFSRERLGKMFYWWHITRKTTKARVN